MKHLSFLTVILSFIFFSFLGASAQIKDGEVTVMVGNTVTVSIGATYQRTLDKATGISYTWTAGSSAISIQSKTSKTCTIKGIAPGTTKLNYHCSYYIDGYLRTMDFYYDITVKSNTVLVTSVTMTPEVSTLEVGEYLQLVATAYPTNATNRSLNWYSENPSIASVSSSGIVNAKANGTVKVWAHATDGSGAGNYCTITVQSTAPVSSITLSEYEKTLEVGEEFMITATVLPINAANKNVLWLTSDSSVAKVSQGLVTAIGPGQCRIMAWAADGSKVVRVCAVTVEEPECYWLSVMIPNGNFALDVTNQEKVRVRLKPDEGYKIHSVTLNGRNQQIDNEEGILVFPKFDSDATLNIVFKELETEVEDIEDSSEEIKVTVTGHEVVISGGEAEGKVSLYSLNGHLIFETLKRRFNVLNSGIYILRLGNHSFKISV